MNEKIWTRDFILLIMSNFLMYITYYAILSSLPIYLVTDLNTTRMQVGVVVGTYTTLGMSVGPVIGLFICHRWGYAAMFVSGCFISIASLICPYAVRLRVSSACPR